MDKLYSPATIKEVQKRHGFQFSKSLGQNFLADGNIVDKIIEGAQVEPSDLVVEIGPGMGVLTDAACDSAGWVIAIELDKNLIPVLRETLVHHKNLSIVNADILKTDLHEIVKDGLQRGSGRLKNVKVIGNLPYYITTPIIMKILENKVPVESITIMLQKEVADRIQAGPGSKTYGALSVAIQYYCTVHPVAEVRKEVFVPKPKVDSSVIRLNIRKEKPVQVLNEEVLFKVVKSSFGQRRKTLSNSMAGLYGMEKNKVIQALEEAGIDPRRRAETLSLEEFAALSNVIFNTI